jgi:hypothetical protein
MEKEILLEKYAEIEKGIIPLKDFLENNKEKPEYKGYYKGIFTLQSPIVYNPEILFIGINPGPGAYNKKNYKNKDTPHPTNYTPISMFGEDKTFSTELSWFEKGNARGFGKTAYEWYHRDKKVNNSFPQRMIDLLYEVAKLKYPNEPTNTIQGKNGEPFWYENFGKSIMYTNLYPIATTDLKDLRSIFKHLTNNSEVRSIIKKPTTITPWELQKHFIRGIDDLVQLTNPKVIVCIGSSAFNDFTYTNNRKSRKVFEGKKGDFNVIGFSRTGNWSGSIPEIAKLIFEKTN